MEGKWLKTFKSFRIGRTSMSERSSIPIYTHKPLMRFLEHQEVVFRLLHLCVTGMTALQELPDYMDMFIKAGYQYRQDLPDAEAKSEYDRERTEFQQVAALANQEETRGFPLLYAHTLVSLWSALEFAIEDVLVGILCNEPQILREPAFSKLKVLVADFENLDRDERMRLVLSEISRDRGAGRRAQGVDHFEYILAPFGLSGPVEDQVKTCFWTMHNLRNVIVHRFSVADSRLVESCPWLNLKSGDPVIIAGRQLEEFRKAFCIYVNYLARRLATRYGGAVTLPEIFFKPSP
jgi:hypothetical protein